jgi:hypothetical protein
MTNFAVLSWTVATNVRHVAAPKRARTAGLSRENRKAAFPDRIAAANSATKADGVSAAAALVLVIEEPVPDDPLATVEEVPPLVPAAGEVGELLPQAAVSAPTPMNTTALRSPHRRIVT